MQLTKNKMDLNKPKIKNKKAKLELEPNFPGVATPQSSERIISIISYAYNPFSAPWGDKPYYLYKNSALLSTIFLQLHTLLASTTYHADRSYHSNIAKSNIL